jgi:hypothetical protein
MFGLVLLLLFGLMIIAVALAEPEGVEGITVRDSERRTTTTGQNLTAQGGNITRINITTRTQTLAWQGFAGNITGSIVLDDASGDRFYSWTLLNVSGEIYASRNGTFSFATILPHNNCTIDEILTGTRADRVNRTYTASANTVNFSVGTIVINSSSACRAWPFINSTVQTTTNLFENVILSIEGNNGSNTTVGGNQSIYAGILQAAGTHGFDVQMYNFQLLVPVNRTSGFNTYFFYAELD